MKNLNFYRGDWRIQERNFLRPCLSPIRRKIAWQKRLKYIRHYRPYVLKQFDLPF